jgi:hypothetical protein
VAPLRKRSPGGRFRRKSFPQSILVVCLLFLLNKACVFSTVLHRNRTLPKHPKRIITKYHSTWGTDTRRSVISDPNVRPEPGRCCSCRPTTVPIPKGLLQVAPNLGRRPKGIVTVVYLTSSCVNWAFFGTSGPF